MVPTPKNHFKQYPFVDREGHIQTFKEAVNNIGQKEFSVLVYYGVAGIGKTSLRKKFTKYLEEYNLKNQQQDITWVSIQQQEVIWTSIDLQLDAHREKSTFLVTLKNDLQKRYKIDFPAFEIAHAIYWKKAKPEIPLRKENYLLFEGDEAFDDFFGVVEKIPYFSIVPAAARLLLKSIPDYLKNWWTKRGEAELQQLSEKESLEIEETLPYFWAQDLNNYLEKYSKSAVLFIDTYEALWEKDRGRGNFNARDKWIRELISNLPESSLWVICGREKLRWNEVDRDWNNCLEQYKLEKLPEEDALDFLNRCGIKEEEIQKVILKGSEGVPYYLELAVDTYIEIAKTGSPVPDNFARTRSEIFDRFMVYLSVPEQETLKVLSTPRFWNKEVFKALIEEFKTGYPLTAFSELNRFSFVQGTEGKLLLHPLMRESLQTYQDHELKNKVHSFICAYYSNQLNSIDIKAITSEHENVLTEAFYHAKESLEAEDLLNWFISASDPFNRAAFWQLIAPMYEEMLQILKAELGPQHPSVATTLNNLAGLYHQMGEYEKALPFYQKALDSYERMLSPPYSDLAMTLNGLAELYRMMGYHDKALPLYQKALDSYERMLNPPYSDIAMTLNDLALLYSDMGNYDKALPLYQNALEIVEKTMGPQHQYVSIILNNLALLYYQMGYYDNQMGYCDKALPLYQRALDIDEKVFGPQHPSVATTLNNLAGLYNSMKNYDKALPLYQRVLEITEKVLGPEHPYVATTLNNIALLYGNMGDYEKSIILYQRALDIREKILDPQHPDVAATLKNLADTYHKIGRLNESLQFYERSLDIIEYKLGTAHPYFSITIDNLIGLYNSMLEEMIFYGYLRSQR